jgi:murein DD-endopeptidase MepM/ murein hydrolase activator NlpD
MLRIITLLVFALLCLLDLQAQYINTDSLTFAPGFEEPLFLMQFDSLNYASPDVELFADENYFHGGEIIAGNLFGNFTLPSDGKVISRYGLRSGRMHTGTDLKMNRGDTVYAVFCGIVNRAKYYYGYGNMVVIDHGNELETGYAHLSSFLVKMGENVRKGQPIGLAGSTGRASTNHLHFEIKEGNRHFDPELVFDFDNGTVKHEVHHIIHLAELKKETHPVVQPSVGPVPQSYTVRSGDSLWKIARRYKITVNALCQLNNLNQNSVLNIGTTLKLY